MKDNISAEAMQILTLDSIVEKEKNEEYELKKQKPAMERYVKRHIIPKIKKAAKKGEYQICYSPQGKAFKYNALIIKILRDNGYSVHPNIFSESFNINWRSKREEKDD